MSLLEVFDRPGRSFYGPGTEHELVKCPDCGLNADALFGDHGLDCLTEHSTVNPRSALGIIYRHARTSSRFNADDCRDEMDQLGVKESSRGPAFGHAVRQGWIEADGVIRSVAPKTKGARLTVYKSLRFQQERVPA